MTTLQEKINTILSRVFYFGATSLKVVSEESGGYEEILLEGGVTICLPDLDVHAEYCMEFGEEWSEFISISNENGEYEEIHFSPNESVYDAWKEVKKLLQK